jgi:hypothetical protein
MKKTRYWFSFDLKLVDEPPPGLLIGCGVTAYSYEDALMILRERVFNADVPNPKSVIEDIDVSTLDPGHILPNMGSVMKRGIWFPLGYE